MPERTCIVDGCEEPVRVTACGLCNTHYQRWRRTGKTGSARIRKRPRGRSDYERFASFVDDSGGPDACHVWTGARTDSGYGYGFKAGGKSWSATRWILGHLRGRPLERHEYALHHCDNPPCVNPRHLYIGDQSQNMRDSVVRGRHYEASKTHCDNGHEFTPTNTYVGPNGRRNCRACNREQQRRRRAEKVG